MKDKILEILKNSGFQERSNTYFGESEFLETYFDSIASQVASNFHGYLESIKSLDSQFSLGLRKKVPILDAGSGIGHLSIVLKSHDLNVFGVELNDNDLSISRRISSVVISEVDPHSFLLQGNLASLINFADESFALINCSQVLEHVNPSLLFYVFNEFYRILKPGGILRLDLPDYRTPYEPHYRIPWIPFLHRDLAEAWLDGFGRPYGGLDFFYYTSLPQIMGFLQSFPFKILHATTTISEQERCNQVRCLSNYINVNTRSYVDLRRAARKVSEDNIQFPPSSMIIVATKDFCLG
jgi:SAM-dependent methyltransferase